MRIIFDISDLPTKKIRKYCVELHDDSKKRVVLFGSKQINSMCDYINKVLKRDKDILSINIKIKDYEK